MESFGTQKWTYSRRWIKVSRKACSYCKNKPPPHPPKKKKVQKLSSTQWWSKTTLFTVKALQFASQAFWYWLWMFYLPLLPSNLLCGSVLSTTTAYEKAFPSVCNLSVIFTCFPRNYFWSVFLPQLRVAGFYIWVYFVLSYVHGFPKHMVMHVCSRGLDWKWWGKAILSLGGVSHCLLFKCSMLWLILAGEPIYSYPCHKRVQKNILKFGQRRPYWENSTPW